MFDTYSFDVQLQIRSVTWRFFQKIKMNVNWHIHFTLKCHLKFGLQNILETNTLNNQNMILTCKKKQSIQRKYPSVSYVSPHVEDGSPTHCIHFKPTRETCIRASRVFKSDLLRKWLLIAFCLENSLSQIAYLMDQV